MSKGRMEAFSGGVIAILITIMVLGLTAPHEAGLAALLLIPFVTAWMGENQFATWPVALYGQILLLAAVAYFILVRALLSLHGRDSVLATALGEDLKGKISVVIYLVAIPLAFVNSWLACGLDVMWASPCR